MSSENVMEPTHSAMQDGENRLSDPEVESEDGCDSGEIACSEIEDYQMNAMEISSENVMEPTHSAMKDGENLLSDPEVESEDGCVFGQIACCEIKDYQKNAIDEISSLKIEELDSVFAVVSDAFQSQNEMQNQLTIDGLKNHVQLEFNNYTKSLEDVANKFVQDASKIGSNFEKEVKNAFLVSVVTDEISKGHATFENFFVRFLAVVTAVYIFVCIFAIPETVEAFHELCYGFGGVLAFAVLVFIPVSLMGYELFPDSTSKK